MASAEKIVFRAGGFAPKLIRWVAPTGFVFLLAAWEWAARSGFISPITAPPPSEIVGALDRLFRSGDIWLHLSASLQRLSLGWTAGTCVGLIVGLGAGLFTPLRSIVLPFVSAIFPIPKIALLPLFIVWFGIGEESKFATIFFGTLFPTIIAACAGADNVDRTLIRMAQSFGLPWFAIVRKIIVPGAMPGIIAGFRISASIAIILLVAAEMIGAEYGLGAYVLQAGNLMASDALLAGIFLLSALGLSVNLAINVLEKRLLGWRLP
ncbi:ABC transporter permease subunit [Mesorhizobium sp. NBSH29]|uniref:ABC transporter permease n=1 Tax=Mesorhizobium sp. NBSH29 TaxID=2654249 RepID=UPI001896A09D|nr:ABC transporter permease [Mesorhizobium sp. NBSH29]QPC86318.1 ABC transporter permease subunit [Mesorhizobium sp. NBSH29]